MCFTKSTLYLLVTFCLTVFLASNEVQAQYGGCYGNPYDDTCYSLTTIPTPTTVPPTPTPLPPGTQGNDCNVLGIAECTCGNTGASISCLGTPPNAFCHCTAESPQGTCGDWVESSQDAGYETRMCSTGSCVCAPSTMTCCQYQIRQTASTTVKMNRKLVVSQPKMDRLSLGL